MLIHNNGQFGNSLLVTHQKGAYPPVSLINDGALEPQFRDAFQAGDDSRDGISSIFDPKMQKLVCLRQAAPQQSLPEILGPGWRDIDVEDAPGTWYQLDDSTGGDTEIFFESGNRVTISKWGPRGNHIVEQSISAHYNQTGIIADSVRESINLKGGEQDYLIKSGGAENSVQTLACTLFHNASRWNTVDDSEQAFDEVDRRLGQELVEEGSSYSNMNGRWLAADEIVNLSKQNTQTESDQEVLAKQRAYMGILANLPENLENGGLGAMVKQVEKAAPGGTERAPYLSALATGSAILAARFATDKTLELLKDL